MDQITHNLPIPPIIYKAQRGRISQHPFRDMAVGDSIFVEGKASTAFWQAVTGFQFTRRSTVENGRVGERVWRTL